MSNKPYYISHKNKCVLIWSPKCACTSLHHAFVRTICGISDPGDPRIIAQKLNMIKHNYKQIPKDYTVYWGVRNPFDRIVSSYFNKFVWYGKRKLTKNTLENFSGKFLKQIDVDYNNLTFHKMLKGIAELKARKLPIDGHFNGQVNLQNYHLIKNHPKLIIFDIENIPSVFKIDYKKNATKSTENPVKKNCCHIKASDMENSMLLKENFKAPKRFIRNLFQLDYEIFKQHGIIY